SYRSREHMPVWWFAGARDRVRSNVRSPKVLARHNVAHSGGDRVARFDLYWCGIRILSRMARGPHGSRGGATKGIALQMASQLQLPCDKAPGSQLQVPTHEPALINTP